MIYAITFLQGNIFGNKVFHQIVGIQVKRTVLLSLIMCFYTALNLNLWLNSQNAGLSTHRLAY